MKSLRPLCHAAAAGMLLVALASPAVSFAQDQEHHHKHHREMDPQKRLQWVQARLDKEAVMLEIKTSQQAAWEGYASAAVETMTAFGNRKPMPSAADAATTMRQHADRAAVMAQNLGKLADATEKLQSVLNEEQRKVFDRIVREHSQFHGRHHGEGHSHRPHESGTAPAAAKP